MKKQNVYLDMDGTIADLYNSKDWLYKLENEVPGVFQDLEPMVTQEVLLNMFPTDKYDIKILSMTPKGASEQYCKTSEAEKNQWLDKHFPKLNKRIYKKYGSNKNLKNSKNAILIDDNATIRENFKGLALNPAALWG